jgi:hypothetical protein
MRALRHEVRAAWRALDASDESGELTLTKPSASAPAVHAATAWVNEVCAKQRALRAHPGLQHIVDTLRCDRDSWAADERDNAPGQTPDPMHMEQYDGEARERREAYDALLKLLTAEAP